MIVRNEEKIILETLESIRQEISGWCICDTGSSDSTVPLIREFFQRAKIPGNLEHHEWVDFSTNRNLCLEEGRIKIGGICDYWLILDADQQLQNETPNHLWQYLFDKDAYYLKETSHGFTFHNIRVIKVGDLFEYRGSIHESLYTTNKYEGEITLGNLPDGFHSIHDNTQTRSIEQDILLLSKELENDPSSTRAHFYLAKAYRHLPDFDQTLYHYAKRIALEDQDSEKNEEVFQSYFQIALLVEDLFLNNSLTEKTSDTLIEHGIIEQSIMSIRDVAKLYRASLLYLDRYEPYCQISMLFWNQLRDSMECLQSASQGLSIDPILPMNSMTTEYPLSCLHFMKCICGFHSGHYVAALDSCRFTADNRVVLSGNIPEWKLEFFNTSKEYLERMEHLALFNV
ncbi:hypothetical protein M9434_002536 [Picochlorum sp. BPE23]|nr:hypothetical protein M9434_002536 [Picochlorum sp. BPE23]